LLEELLMGFDGTLLLVSHDREFLDNVVTSTLVFEGDGRVGEYVGGYSDWLRQRRQPKKAAQGKQAPVVPAKKAQKPAGKAKKLSYKDQRELDALPVQIEALEAEQGELEAAISLPAFYQQTADAVKTTLTRLEAVNAELEACYERWGELEG
jgi:ATP-binding cassette subfamily F protein uup